MSILAIIFALVYAGAPDLPNPKLTPGDVLQVTAKEVCVKGYAGRVRNVPESEKRRVYAEYGITHHRKGEYEVDHLISLELGGSNDIQNLWPESYETKTWNAHVKDKLENQLHLLVCRGEISLEDAQHAISHDWITEYRRLFRDN